MRHKIVINNKEVEIKEGLTILQACESVGIQIPRFCYHEQLSIAGNCRMCLVHLDKSVKPVASCAMTIAPGMKIFTDSLIVRKAREGVMEFLLANHPLDCPICDQGGECDLQDQALIFGNDRGRFYETKRSVSNKNCGPLIKTVMTRCIHCTRCVRFSGELSGYPELVTTGRGSKTEIGNYVSRSILSVVSGNMIDLCPVGALTSKSYAFTARSWELKRTETIDTLDSMGSNISVQTSGRRIMRVLPVLHEGINEEWINDRTRFSYDGLTVQRLVKPMLKVNNSLKKSNWKSNLTMMSYFLSLLNEKNRINFYLGQELSVESISYLRMFRNTFGNVLINYEDILGKINLDFRKNYLFNSTLDGFKKVDSCLIVGVNMTYEMPLILMRLRKEQRIRNLSIGLIGIPNDYGLEVYRLGNSVDTLLQFIEGRHRFCTVFKRSGYPCLIIGSSILQMPDLKLLDVIRSKLTVLNKSDWDGFNILHTGAAKVGYLELGLQNDMLNSGKRNNFFLDNIPYTHVESMNNSIYMGTHGDSILQNAKSIVPCSSSIESNSLYFNIEGRAQKTNSCLNLKNSIINDYEVLGSMFYASQDVHDIPENLIETRKELGKVSSFLLNSVGYSNFACSLKNIRSLVNRGLINSYFSNFYITNLRTKSSGIMNQCLKEANQHTSRCYNF